MRASLVCLVIALSVFASGPALADTDPCTYYTIPGRETVRVFPAEGATDVPTNTLIWVGQALTQHREDRFEDSFELSLRNDDEMIIGPTPSYVDLASPQFLYAGPLEGYTVVRPATALAPNTAYTLFVDLEPITTFTTGSGPDETPPAIPELDVGAVTPGSAPSPWSCGDGARAMVGIESDAPIRILELEAIAVAGPESFDGEATLVTTEQTVEVTLPRAEGERTLFVGAFDVAGNFSGWSAGNVVAIPAPTCACVTPRVGAASPALVLLGGLVLIGSRRRRR